MDAIDIFKDIATNANNRYVRKFKENGGKVIGYNCSFLPMGEIYHAAGMMGFRLRANEAGSTAIGDAYYGAVICSFPKSMLHMAGEGKYDFLDGLVTSTGCDALRRLYDCWRKAAEDYEGILPDFFEMVGIPHKSLDFNIDWFVEEMKIHIEKLENHFNVNVTDENLKLSISKFNRVRGLLKKLDEYRIKDQPSLSGEAALAVHTACSGMPVDDCIPLLEELLADLEKNNSGIKGKRLMLVGSTNDDIQFVKAMEDEGCVIVADTICFGSRFFEQHISEDGNPVEALAKGYLDDVKCPRMIGQFKKRKAYMLEKARRAKVDGIILQHIRFCDLHGSENGVLERDFEALGIPCLVIERDYGSHLETGRIKMRADAFLRRLKTSGTKNNRPPIFTEETDESRVS